MKDIWRQEARILCLNELPCALTQKQHQHRRAQAYTRRCQCPDPSINRSCKPQSVTGMRRTRSASYGSNSMICMTIKVKHLPPTQAPFKARFKKALRLNRDPVLFFAHQTGYQELGKRFPSYSSTQWAYCRQGGSTLYPHYRAFYHSTIEIYTYSLHIGARSWRLNCCVGKGRYGEAQKLKSCEAPR